MNRVLSAFFGIVVVTGLLALQYVAGGFFINGPLRAASVASDSKAATLQTRTDVCLSGDAEACAREAAALSLVAGRVGEALALPTYKLTVLAVEPNAASYGLVKPREGYKLIAVNLAIESKADRDVTVNSYFSRLRDASGLIYPTVTGGREPILMPVTNLERNRRVQGWMTFEVLEAATGLVLTYQLAGSADKIEVALDTP